MTNKNIVDDKYKYSDLTAKIIGAALEVHLAQAINYLEAYNLEIGLLINFGSKSMEFKRLMKTKRNHSPSINHI